MPRDFKISYTKVLDPKWANEQHTMIDCIVQFDHIPEAVPFTANPNDIEPHGREIFARCQAGEFGEVSEFIVRPNANSSVGFSPPAGWHDIELFLNDANQENANGTDRGCVLVWTAMVDELLRRLIEAFIIPDEAKAKNFLANNGPASSFSARIKLSYLLGLIAADEMALVDKIREIRNDFAHKFGISLSDQSFAGRCQYLYETLCADGIRLPPRMQFTASCARLAMILTNRIESDPSQRRQVLVESVPIHLR